MKSLTSPIGLNPGGVGPKIFRNAMPFLIVGILAGIFFPSVSGFPFYNKAIFRVSGLILMPAGIIIYIIAIIQFMKDFPKGKLITHGVFSYSRNPLYASWILGILPGLALFFNNWFFLLAAISMYISLIFYIKSEEEQLLAAFGNEYAEYKSSVRRVLFIPTFH
jgi:protein-S-isoprenylcysteine O-methyltransferase Ste14